jgi:hypothetical protein
VLYTAVEDFTFRVDQFPTPSTKAVVEDFVITGGGCAANAAISIARLGGHARFAGPLGGDAMSDRIVEGSRLLCCGRDEPSEFEAYLTHSQPFWSRWHIRDCRVGGRLLSPSRPVQRQ